MKAVIAACLLSFVPACAFASQSDIDAMDVNHAWKVTDKASGVSEIVFDPVEVRDWDQNREWISAVSCDLKYKECYSFDFNPKNVDMVKISPKIAQAWKEGKLKAF